MSFLSHLPPHSDKENKVHEESDLNKLGVDTRNENEDPVPAFLDSLQSQYHRQFRPSFAWIRVFLLFNINVLGFCTLSTLSLHVPLFCGRYALYMTNIKFEHDIYAFTLGLTITLILLAAIKYCVEVAIKIWKLHVVIPAAAATGGGGGVTGGGGGGSTWAGTAMAYDRMKAIWLVCQHWISAASKVLFLTVTMGVMAPLLLGSIFREVTWEYIFIYM
jgi:hypothetical protein